MTKTKRFAHGYRQQHQSSAAADLHRSERSQHHCDHRSCILRHVFPQSEPRFRRSNVVRVLPPVLLLRANLPSLRSCGLRRRSQRERGTFDHLLILLCKEALSGGLNHLFLAWNHFSIFLTSFSISSLNNSFTYLHPTYIHN